MIWQGFVLPSRSRPNVEIAQHLIAVDRSIETLAPAVLK